MKKRPKKVTPESTGFAVGLDGGPEGPARIALLTSHSPLNLSPSAARSLATALNAMAEIEGIE